MMICTACNADIAMCTCPNRDAQLKTACDSPHVAFKWCRVCDRHYARCTCVVPDFYVRAGGKELPTPDGGFTMGDGTRVVPDKTLR